MSITEMWLWIWLNIVGGQDLLIEAEMTNLQKTQRLYKSKFRRDDFYDYIWQKQFGQLRQRQTLFNTRQTRWYIFQISDTHARKLIIR